MDLGVLPVADLAHATARLREVARDQAWAHEEHGGRVIDVCPACTRFRWATGYEGIGPPPAPPVLPPEESWVSATDDWLRRQAAKREEQVRLEQAQRPPGESFRWPKGWREEIRRRRPGEGE